MPGEPYLIPRPGPTLTLPAWSAVVTERVRGFVPEVRAARIGRVIIWRHLGRAANFTADGATWHAKFTDAPGAGPTLARIYFDRHDDFTAANLGKTLAGFFDNRHCT
jgi:hypothetical protein